jgi:serine/threonine protein phosphatase 1
MLLTYAVGDIHGSLHKLERLLASCRRHAGGRDAMLVFLGDYIDRGPDSAGVVRLIMSLPAQWRGRVVTLMGNHEEMAVAVAEGAASAATWLINGGAATLESYEVMDAADLPRAHLNWMRALRLSFDDGQRFFVHAGVDPQKPLDAQDESALLWIREPFLQDERDYGRLIVHGHTPLLSAAPELRGNRLNIDTGAVFGGPLTAAVFEDARREPVAFLQAE